MAIPLRPPAVRCGQQQGKMWTHQSHLCFQALKQMAKPEIGTNPFLSVRIWHVEQAAKILRAQRAVAQASNVAHAFHDFDLSRLGTHSFKKTSVTLFSEHQVSWAIISAISGTSIPMLQRSYDVATPVRQHKAMKDVFGQAWQPVLLTQRAHLEEKDSQPAKYCGKCGLSRRHPDDIFCTACGSEL